MAPPAQAQSWPRPLKEGHVYPHQFVTINSLRSGERPAGGIVAPLTTWREPTFADFPDGMGWAGYWVELGPLNAGPYQLSLSFASVAYEGFLLPRDHPERLIRFEAGRPATTESQEITLEKKKIVNFTVFPGDDWILVLNVSDFHRTLGGFWHAPRIAPGSTLETELYLWTGLDFAIVGAMIIIMLYTFMLYVRRRADLPALYLSLTCLAIILRLIGIESLLSYFVDNVTNNLLFEVQLRFEYGAMAFVTLTILEFLRHTFKRIPQPKILYIVCHSASLLLIALSLTTSPVTFTKYVALFQANVLMHIFCMFGIIIAASRKNEDGAISMLVGLTVPLVTGVVDVINSQSGSAVYVSHFGGAIFIFIQSQILAKRSAKAYERAEHLTEHLQQEVDIRTQQIRNIMDNVPEGLFTVGRDLKIQGIASRYASVIFAKGTLDNLPNLLMNNTAIDKARLDLTTAVINAVLFEDILGWDINSDLLFAEIETSDMRSLAFQWHPIAVEDRVHEILVIVRDVTELRDLREMARFQEQEMVLISTLAKARTYSLHTYLVTSKDLLQRIHILWRVSQEGRDPKVLEPVLPLLHTFKGNSRQLGFSDLARDIHIFEQALIDVRQDVRRWGEIIGDGLLDLATSLQIIEDLYERYWGDEKLAKDQLIKEPFHDKFDDLRGELALNAKQLGKPLPELRVQWPEKLVLGPQFQHGLANILGHLFRNAIAHGIEDAEERIRKGKAESGYIEMHGEFAQDRLYLEVLDDGRGLDLNALAQRFPDLKRLPLADQLELIFVDGFSSAALVSELSGRGLGMSAVRLEVERLGGRIRLEAIKPEMMNAEARFVPFRIVLSFPGLALVQ